MWECAGVDVGRKKIKKVRVGDFGLIVWPELAEILKHKRLPPLLGLDARQPSAYWLKGLGGAVGFRVLRERRRFATVPSDVIDVTAETSARNRKGDWCAQHGGLHSRKAALGARFPPSESPRYGILGSGEFLSIVISSCRARCCVTSACLYPASPPELFHLVRHSSDDEERSLLARLDLALSILRHGLLQGRVEQRFVCRDF